MEQCRQHRNLAAHAVAQQGSMVDAARPERSAEVLDHFAVGHAVRPRRGAVVAQIERENAMACGKLLGDRAPIAAAPEQTVQDSDRRPHHAVFSGGKLNSHFARMASQGAIYDRTRYLSTKAQSMSRPKPGLSPI